MTQTLPFVVRCLSIFLWSFLLLPFSLQATVIPSNNNPIGDTLVYFLNDCNEEITICIDSLPLTDVVNLSVTLNGSPYQGTIEGCNLDTTSAYTYSTLFGQGDSGPYAVTNWPVGDTSFTGTFETIPDLVDSMNVWNPAGNWLLDTDALLISGGEGGQTYGVMAVQVVSTNTPSFIGYNFGVEAHGLSLNLGTGIHNINILDTLNNTIRKAIIAVSCSAKRTVTNRVLPNQTGIHCLDFNRLLSEVQVIGFCDLLSQENVDFELFNNDSCISYTGVVVGFDTACVVVCDIFNFCDTTELIIETYDIPHYREATINLKEGTSQSYCLDTTLIVGPLTGFFNSCPEKSGLESQIILDQSAYCVTVDGITPGQDTSCLVMCNQFGQCDTTILYVNVHPAPITETIRVTITEGDSTEICPETTELAGIVTGIDHFCENNDTETIISNINNVDLCFNVTAIQVGQDSICAVICDNFLICDTTYYIIEVVSNSPSLTATPDFDTTSTNSPITIDILGNDSIPDGILTEMEILASNGAPTNSTTITNPDGTITYTPNQDFCGDLDRFQYRICNDAGCDTTMVSVLVTCETANRDLVIYTGFSPNGDGRNDYFQIDGIAQYPNNKLMVFNRWGTKVYEMDGYKNAWDGTWNKKLIPDGTYFYLLNDGEGKNYSGFLYIRR